MADNAFESPLKAKIASNYMPIGGQQANKHLLVVRLFFHVAVTRKDESKSVLMTKEIKALFLPTLCS